MEKLNKPICEKYKVDNIKHRIGVFILNIHNNQNILEYCYLFYLIEFSALPEIFVFVLITYVLMLYSKHSLKSSQIIEEISFLVVLLTAIIFNSSVYYTSWLSSQLDTSLILPFCCLSRVYAALQGCQHFLLGLLLPIKVMAAASYPGFYPTVGFFSFPLLCLHQLFYRLLFWCCLFFVAHFLLHYSPAQISLLALKTSVFQF